MQKFFSWRSIPIAHAFKQTIRYKSLFNVLVFFFLTLPAFAQIPVVSSFSPTIVTQRTTVTITGSNFTDKTYSFESRALPLANEVLPLSQTQYRSSQYTYKVNLDNLNNVTAYLRDNYLGTQQELTNNAETLAVFTVDSADAQSTAANR
jgi:hypothetical protein